ncbi:hypothetical protein EAF00_007331 [Botryotinia globosa]|nr:hypothetical protein EAF00_007331 [Botryotinia globosa]
MESFNILIDEIDKTKYELHPDLQNEAYCHARVLSVSDEHPACAIACSNLAISLNVLTNSIRNSIMTNEKTHNVTPRPFHTTIDDDADDPEVMFTDRQYANRSQSSGQSSNPVSSFRRSFNNKKCHLCGKSGCWSTNHLVEDVKKSREEWKKKFKSQWPQKHVRNFSRRYMNYIVGMGEIYDDTEFCYLINCIENTPDQWIQQFDKGWSDDDEDISFLTETGPMCSSELVSALDQQSTEHLLHTVGVRTVNWKGVVLMV